MPFESKAQQRFMFAKHPEMAKEWADKTPDISALPEHVKKMADGGEVSNAEQMEPGLYGDTDPGHLQAIVNSLAGGMGAGGLGAGLAADLPAALEGLGETGEVSLGKGGPEANDWTSRLTRYSKGVMGKGTPNEVTIESVKGAPEDVAKLGYGPDPASIPSHILDAHGIQGTPAVSESLSPTNPNAQDLRQLWANTAKEQSGTPLEALGHYVNPDTVGPSQHMNKGGYPHVTFMEDQTPEEVKKTVHMAKGGKTPHEEKLKSIYKAMGIKGYDDGGVATPAVDPNAPPADINTPEGQSWIQNALTKLGFGHTPQGATNVADTANTLGAVGSALSNALPATMPDIAEGAANVASTPGIAPAVNAAIGTNLAEPAAPAPIAAAPAPVAIPATPTPAISAGVVPSAIPSPNTASTGMPNLNTMFNQDTSKLTAGSNPEDRQALVDKLQAQQHGLGAIVAQAVAGLGDALSAKGGKETHALGNIFAMNTQQRQEALANFDQARQDRIQKLALQTQMGDNALKQAAAADAYGTDEHLNSLVGAPQGTMKKDLPTYFSLMAAQVAQQEKNADLYMKAHAQAGTDVDNAIKNSSILGIKPSPAQLQASGSKLADQYYNRAKGNILVKPSDGGQAQWIPAQNLGKAKQMDPNLTVQP